MQYLILFFALMKNIWFSFQVVLYSNLKTDKLLSDGKFPLNDFAKSRHHLSSLRNCNILLLTKQKIADGISKAHFQEMLRKMMPHLYCKVCKMSATNNVFFVFLEIGLPIFQRRCIYGANFWRIAVFNFSLDVWFWRKHGLQQFAFGFWKVFITSRIKFTENHIHHWPVFMNAKLF